jgi:hypothetical protein
MGKNLFPNFLNPRVPRKAGVDILSNVKQYYHHYSTVHPYCTVRVYVLYESTQPTWHSYPVSYYFTAYHSCISYLLNVCRIFFHADMVCCDYMPGVALLHCIKQHQVPERGCRTTFFKKISESQPQLGFGFISRNIFVFGCELARREQIQESRRYPKDCIMKWSPFFHRKTWPDFKINTPNKAFLNIISNSTRYFNSKLILLCSPLWGLNLLFS